MAASVGRCGRRGRAGAGGFTLMEILVVLVLLSLTVSLAFEMLGAYRLAKERVLVRTGDLSRRALVESWFVESMQGVVAIEDDMLEGAAGRVAASSLNPVTAGRGAPTPLEWEIQEGTGPAELVYREYGTERWRVPLPVDVDAARFVYFDPSGAAQPQWPPSLGVQGESPAAVALVFDSVNGRQRVMLGSVRGPRQPQPVVFEMGED